MRLLEVSFFILQCCGFWRPTGWSGCKSWLYNVYTVFMVFVIYSVTVSQFVELLASMDNVEQFTHNALILLTTANACAKVFNIIRCREDIRALVGSLESEPCCPRNETEEIIQGEFNRSIRKMAIWYATLTEISAGLIELDSILHDPPKRQLQFNTWLPYALDTELKYWLSYIHQVVANVLGSLINISYDTLVPGCMLQTCAQFALFKHRILQLQSVYSNDEEKNLEKSCKLNQQIRENESISDCVRHHLEIFNFADCANSTFAYTIFIQYSVSLIILCVSVFELTRVQPMTPEFTAIIVYLFCMTVQIFMFCFYGNIVMQESKDVCDDIYQMNWVPLSVPTKRSLLIIMCRTLRPIKFTSGHVVVLCLDSFNGILKLSYSAYNVLQQAS